MTATFLETPIFPDDLGFWANGGIQYNTTINPYGGGWESRYQNWMYDRGAWDLQNVMRAPGMQPAYTISQLRNLFRVAKGRLIPFRFRDWTDYQDEGGGAFQQTPNGALTAFQMVKNYTVGSSTDQRIIVKPRPGSIAILLNGMPLTFGTGAGKVQLDTTTGIATFGTAPANTDLITWTGDFDVPVRFDTDQLIATPDISGLWILQDLPIVEVRLV
jgi:uncharacterized protein (TIGR02217 family)